MLDRPSVLDLLYSKRVSPTEFNWDRLWAPSIYNFMSEFHLEKLYNIATSVRYAGDSDKKDDAIRSIMYPLGFRRFAAGTNRIVYTYLEDTSFLVKIAIDKVGLQNSPDEFKNQMILKPFVCKCFETHPTGIIGSFERGLPITNLHEFLSIWDDVFEAILHMTGTHVVEDIGTNFFMNWCIRKNFGPVLCDYPEVFELDGNKLFCNRPIYPGTKFPVCGGPIDHDAGFNCLVCTKCGKQYRARELSAAIKRHDIIMKGEYDMDVMIVRGDEILVDGRDIVGTDTIQKPTPTKIKAKRSREIRASIVVGDTVIAGDNMISRSKTDIDWEKLPEPIIIPTPPQPEVVTRFNNSVFQQKPNPVEEYLKDKPDLRKEIEGIFGCIPDVKVLDELNRIFTGSVVSNTMLPANESDPTQSKEEAEPVSKFNNTAEQSSTQTKDLNINFQVHPYSSPEIDKMSEKLLKAYYPSQSYIDSATQDTMVHAAERRKNASKTITIKPFEDSLNESTEKLNYSGEPDIESIKSLLADQNKETEEQEEIGIIPPDQIETPDWNIIDTNAPEPIEPDYNSIYYNPDNPTPSVDTKPEEVKQEAPKEEEEQAEENPIEEVKEEPIEEEEKPELVEEKEEIVEEAKIEPEKPAPVRKEYGDKEPVGSSVMSDALKGFRMDDPMPNTAPPQFRKRPEVPKGLDNF